MSKDALSAVPVKSTRGRKKGFSAERLVGLDLEQMRAAASWGDVALKQGGIWARRFLDAEQKARTAPTPENLMSANNEFHTARLRLGRRDAKFFREVADFLEGQIAYATTRTPADRTHLLAVDFVNICAIWPRGDAKLGTVVQRLGRKTVAEAWARPRAMPSVSQLRDFLEEVLGDDAPADESTVRDIARRVGINRRP